MTGGDAVGMHAAHGGAVRLPASSWSIRNRSRPLVVWRLNFAYSGVLVSMCGRRGF